MMEPWISLNLLEVDVGGTLIQSIKFNLNNLDFKACTSTQRKESLILIYKLHTSSKSIELLLYLTTVMLMLFCFCQTTNNRKKEKL